MPKFFGPVGFVESQETEEGSSIWEDVAVEKNYRGEVTKNTKRWDTGEHLNKNLSISNTISIVADPYVSNHLYAIKYIKWLGSYWEITSVDVQYPRLVLTLGGLYNGPVAGSSGSAQEHPRIQ